MFTLCSGLQRVVTTIVLGLFLVCVNNTPAQQPTKPVVKTDASPAVARERWRAIFLEGINIGYERDAVRLASRNGRDVVVNESIVVMSVALPRERGAIVAPADTRTKIIMRTEETEAGDLLAFHYEVQGPVPVAVVKHGGIVNDRIRVETNSRGILTTSDDAWPLAVKGPAFVDRELLRQPLKPNEVRTYLTFDPRTATVDSVRLAAGEVESTPMPDGTERRLLHVVSTHSIAPGIVFHEFMDEAGESWKTTIPSQGMVVFTTSKAAAMSPFTFPELE